MTNSKIQKNKEYKPISQRNYLFDALRGGAIILVLLGHAIQVNNSLFDSNIFFRIIYSFHMPLFMFISGYVNSFQKINNHFEFIFKKFKRLIIPFFCWYFIALIYQSTTQNVDVFESIKKVIKYPDIGLWFLWILFFEFLLFSGVDYFFKKIKIQSISEIVLLIIAILIKYIPYSLFDFSLLQWYFLFFISGYIVANHQNVYKKYRYQVLTLLSLIFFILVQYWMRDGNPTFMPLLRSSSSIVLTQNSVPILSLYNLVVPFTGIAFSILLMTYIIKVDLFKKLLIFIGRYSLDIYSVQYIYFFVIGVNSFYIFTLDQNLFKVLYAFIMSLMLSMGVSIWLLRKLRISKLLLLGI